MDIDYISKILGIIGICILIISVLSKKQPHNLLTLTGKDNPIVLYILIMIIWNFLGYLIIIYTHSKVDLIVLIMMNTLFLSMMMILHEDITYLSYVTSLVIIFLLIFIITIIYSVNISTIDNEMETALLNANMWSPGLTMFYQFINLSKIRKQS